MPTKYRSAVEKFFRQGRIGIVFATGTLAYGIHMPCRAVVFAGDTSYLNPMNFRQMSGRCGRRGLDLRGDIIFFGFPASKVKRLMSSDVPTLHGNVTLSNSFIMSMLIKQSQLAKDTDPGQKLFEESISRIVNLPLFMHASHSDHLMKLHFRFCADYLRRMQLLDTDGNPTDLSDLVSHLAYTEPSNMIFVSILANGWFSRVCEDESVITERRDKRVMHMLAYIFARKPAPPDHFLFSNGVQRTSKVFLEDISEEDKAILRHHDDIAMASATDYLKCYAQGYRNDLGSDNRLPLSNVTISDVKGSAPISLSDQAIPPTVRSAFCGLSGHFDSFCNAADMHLSLREGLFMDPLLIPIMVPVSSRLNAYAMDFYTHGQVNAIANENWIHEPYEPLLNFCIILKALSAALENRFTAATAMGATPFQSKAVVDTFKRISSKFEASFNDSFRRYSD